MDPKTFEQIGVVLARKVLGAGVEAYGDGPDGGREATFEGRVEWSNTPGLGDDVWEGYAVIQAKHRSAMDPDPSRNLNWLKAQIRNELNGWQRAVPGKRRMPEYLIFITNAKLSPAPGGGVESIQQYLQEHTADLRAKGLKGWKVWHRDQLISLLATYPDVRRHFPSFLSTAVEAILTRLESLERADLQPTRDLLVEHARQGLLHEQWVNFGEAGVESRRPISRIAVDLPVLGPERIRSNAVESLLKDGERVLRRSITSADCRRHVVLTGAPGNGKSTISQYLVQLYRAAFVASETFGPELSRIREGVGQSLQRLHLSQPRQQRWPVRVDMAEWASSELVDRPVMNWLAHIVGIRAGQDVAPRELRRWMREWPWLVVFDGLDEVTNLDARRRILGHVSDFVSEIDEDDCDVFLIVTTRPGGYTDELPGEHFAQYELDYFTNEEAVVYGRLITSVRLADEQDRAKLVLDRFAEASKDPATLRLLKTPLQVLIVTVILERNSTLPVSRYELFWTYFDTLFDRERSKSNELATFITQHQQDVRHVHEVIGFELQVLAEGADNSRATLPLEELRRIADERFQEMGYDDPERRRQLTRYMVEAATRRLILLVPGEPEDNGSETVTFELRSLQELMAARRISSGEAQLVKRRLTLMSPSPHWRNTWVFAAGRLFAEDDQSRWDLVTEVVASIDKDEGWPGWLLPTAPGLSAELLDDGLALAKPKWQTNLLSHALTALTGPMPSDMGVVAKGLSVSWLGPVQQKLVVRKVEEALGGAEAARYAASRLLAESWPLRLQFQREVPATYKEIQVKTAPKGKNTKKLGSLIRDDLVSGFDTDMPAEFDAVLVELDTVRTVEQRDVLVGYRPRQPQQWPQTVAILTDPEKSFRLQYAFDTLPADCWPLVHLAAREIFPALARRSIGPVLRTTFELS